MYKYYATYILTNYLNLKYLLLNAYWSGSSEELTYKVQLTGSNSNLSKHEQTMNATSIVKCRHTKIHSTSK